MKMVKRFYVFGQLLALFTDTDTFIFYLSLFFQQYNIVINKVGVNKASEVVRS